jgi:hypothetical protein
MVEKMKESGVTSHIRLDAAQQGVFLLRNNSGGFYDETGRFVRYGLGGFTDRDKKASSDYIGITPVFVTPDMVGTVVGVFTAVEMKPEGWKILPSDKRALYQRNFHDIVIQSGGFAGFATNVPEFRRIIGREKR